MAYRLHRFSQSVRVRQSIGAITWVRTSVADLESQILALSASNSHDHTSFRLHQLSAISPRWRLLPLHASPNKEQEDSSDCGSNKAQEREDGNEEDSSQTKQKRRRQRRHGDNGETYRVEPGHTKTYFLRLMPRDAAEDTANDRLTFVRSSSLLLVC